MNTTQIVLDQKKAKVLKNLFELEQGLDAAAYDGLIPEYDALKKEIDGLDLTKNEPCPVCKSTDTSLRCEEGALLHCHKCGYMTEEHC
jgi:hypothetical protein